MAAQIGSSQTSVLETVPGIASVLRSPVADALVNVIRAAAGAREFRIEEARELIQYSVRRGLVGPDEGDRLSAEIDAAQAPRRSKPAAKAAPRPARPSAKAPKRPTAKKPRSKKKR